MNLVSIVVPVYNVENYLSKCLDSIIGQTYDELEIILVNDGSKDNSGKICNVYARKDNRIKVIHKENTGVSDTRNCGIERCKGKYICFIDADDTVENTYIEKLLEPTMNEDYDLVVCNYSKVYEDGRRIANVFEDELYKRLTGNFYCDYRIIKSVLPFPVMKLYKTSIIKDNNIQFPKDFPDAEDQMFNFAYYIHVKKYSYVNISLYNYLQRTNSISKNSSLKSFLFNIERLRVEKEFLCNYIENGNYCLIDSAIWIIHKYVVLSDVDDNFMKFKERVRKIKSIIYNELNDTVIDGISKKNIAICCLKYDFIKVLYVYFYLKRLVKKG